MSGEAKNAKYYLHMVIDIVCRWTIRARVTAKPSLRHYSNSRGEGRVMSVELVDESVSQLPTCLHTMITSLAS